MRKWEDNIKMDIKEIGWDWAGLWLWMRTGSGLLWTRQRNFESHFFLAKWLWASRKGIFSIEFVETVLTREDMQVWAVPLLGRCSFCKNSCRHSLTHSFIHSLVLHPLYRRCQSEISMTGSKAVISMNYTGIRNPTLSLRLKQFLKRHFKCMQISKCLNLCTKINYREI
jgi:hypothetical protein